MPQGVTTDAEGNVYIADVYNARIRKVDTGGIITTIAGNGTIGYLGDNGFATLAELDDPYATGFDPEGNMYIADLGNNVIRKVTGVTSVNGPVAPEMNVSIFPNPAIATIAITAGGEINKVLISSILGQIVYSNTFHESMVVVDVSGLAPGIYFVKVNNTEVRKFVKE
jgi:hypothetical protein